MRVRTEDKRREIVEIAAQLFQEQGYDRTSMSQISERVGGSKATLYGYFKSKEELLMAVLYQDIGTKADEMMANFLAVDDLREGLVALGIAYLTRRLSDRPTANMRMLAAQPEELGLGKRFFENVLQPAWRRLAWRIGKMMDDGQLRQADPWMAAMQWKGMVEADMTDRRLIGALREADPEEVRRYAVAAADAFLTLYGAKVGKD